MARKNIETLFDDFLDKQTTFFSTLNALSTLCREKMEGLSSVHEHAMYKNVLNSAIRFESRFGQLEADFWAYLEGTADLNYYSEVATAAGYNTFVEYLLGDLEKSHAWIEDIITEVYASGFDPKSTEDLSDEFWALMDATEELIEASAEPLPENEILQILSQIPSQRRAPIELEVHGTSFGLKRTSRGATKASSAVMRQASEVVRSEAKLTLQELEGTNCDRRFVTYFKKLSDALDREFEGLSPVEIGINLVIVENTMKSVQPELADALNGHILGNVLNIRQFIGNFRDWREYSGLSDIDVTERIIACAVGVEETLSHEVFSAEVFDQAKFYASVLHHTTEDNRKTLGTAFVYGIQNIIIATAREALKYAKIASEKAASAAGKVVGNAIGVLSVGWILLNYERLMTFAESHISLSWISTALQILRKYLGAP